MGVTWLAPGDRVFGMPRFPKEAACYAEYVVSPSRQLARVPEEWSDVEAGAVPLAGLTAWQALVDTAGVGRGVARARARRRRGRGPPRCADREVARRVGGRNVEPGEARVPRRARRGRGARQERAARPSRSDVVLDAVGGDAALAAPAGRGRRHGVGRRPAAPLARRPGSDRRRDPGRAGPRRAEGARSRAGSARTSTRRSRSRRPPARTSSGSRAAPVGRSS